MSSDGLKLNGFAGCQVGEPSQRASYDVESIYQSKGILRLSAVGSPFEIFY